MSDPSPFPATRGDCLMGPRPCPHRTCRYHLHPTYRDTATWRGPKRKDGDRSRSCALDVADNGPTTLEVVGAIMGITRERVRQIESAAMRKAKLVARRLAPELRGLLAEMDMHRPDGDYEAPWPKTHG